jgi:hypothetical protein
MSTPALNPLVEKIRSKYPGSYDDMDDAALTKAILAKYPQYSDLAAPAIAKPSVDMKTETMSMLEQRTAQTSENFAEDYKHLKPMVQSAANDVYDVSAPNIAHQVYRQFKGLPNTLKELPPKMVMAWLNAAGLKGEGVEAGAGETAAKTEAVAERPSIPASEAPAPTPESPAMPSPVKSPSNFPPRGPVGKFQYDPARIPAKYQPPSSFDTNGITRDIDEDKAIQDAMRTDLGRHGMIARMQESREFSAGHSMDTPKGVLQEQASNTLAAPALVDAGAPNIGSATEPVEFINGAKAYKSGGKWILKDGSQWRAVGKQELKNVVTASRATSASSAQGSDDLTDLLQKSLEMVKAQKAAH